MVSGHIKLHRYNRRIPVLECPYIGVLPAVAKLEYPREPIVTAITGVCPFIKLLGPLCIGLPTYLYSFNLINLWKIHVKQCTFSQPVGQDLFGNAPDKRPAIREVRIIFQIVIGKPYRGNIFYSPFHRCGHRARIKYIDRIIKTVIDTRNAYIGLPTLENFIYSKLYTIHRRAGTFIHFQVGVNVNAIDTKWLPNGYCMPCTGLWPFWRHNRYIANLLHFLNQYLNAGRGDSIVIHHEYRRSLFCHAAKLKRKALQTRIPVTLFI